MPISSNEISLKDMKFFIRYAKLIEITSLPRRYARGNKDLLQCDN